MPIQAMYFHLMVLWWQLVLPMQTEALVEVPKVLRKQPQGLWHVTQGPLGPSRYM